MTKKKTPEQARRIALLVLGMHRSGTSALTRVLNLLGADISQKLMPAAQGNNETGFWEPQDIVAVHDAMLAAAGSGWDDMSSFPASFFSTGAAKGYQAKILDHLQRDFADSTMFTIKDPRVCRLVPFWLELLNRFDAAPYAVIPVRNPLEVARSLKARDGFHHARSTLIWLRHVLEAERDSRSLPRSFVTFDALLEDWRECVRKIFQDLELPLPEISHRFDAEIESFLSPRRRSHSRSLAELEQRHDLVDWVKSAYAALLDFVAGNEKQARKTMDAIAAELNKADLAFGPVLADITMRHATDVASRDGRIEELEMLVEDLEVDLAGWKLAVKSIKDSSSWKVTAPLRRVTAMIKKENVEE